MMTQTALHAIGKPAAMPSRSEQTRSLTYEPHFGLQEKPFSLSADPRFLYRSSVGRVSSPKKGRLFSAIQRYNEARNNGYWSSGVYPGGDRAECALVARRPAPAALYGPGRILALTPGSSVTFP